MEFFSSVPLADPKKCPDNEDHNRLARQVNLRLTRSGPDCLWRIFYLADSIFTNMRNTATPGRPLGINPAEDEWWKAYINIEYPVAATGTGNWPLTLAGTPEGANVMNPLNAFIFGRKTAENKFLEKMGPWAEGNLFDGLVASSRAILSNKQYWEDAYMQRGAIARNSKYESHARMDLLYDTKWDGYSVFGSGRRIDSKYLPDPYDSTFLSTSLTSAAVSTDRYFEEYASTYSYMRYPPAIQGGNFIKYMQAYHAPDGVLKRKNAAKDLMQWGLWCYVYYFRGSEIQRSLFCQEKPWQTKVIDFQSTTSYKISIADFREDRKGPLDICKVGFDFYKYFTRQNVFAPALGIPTKFKATDGMVAHKGYYELDSIGNMKVEPYRVSFSLSIKHNQLNVIPKSLSWVGDGYVQEIGTLKETIPSWMFCSRPWVWNADTIVRELSVTEKRSEDQSPYGKIIGFSKEQLADYNKNKTGVFSCDYDNHKSGRVGRDYLNFDSTSGRGTSNYIKSCIAGYYLQTDPIEDKSCRFKFRIWSNEKIVHETIITNTHSYRVNRKGIGRPAYVFNKMFYFKEGLEPKGESHKFRFQIVPVANTTGYKGYAGEVKKYIPLGNPWSTEVISTHNLIIDPSSLELDRDAGNWPIIVATGQGRTEPIFGSLPVEGENSHLDLSKDLLFAQQLQTGDLVRVKCLKWDNVLPKRTPDGNFHPKFNPNGYTDPMTNDQIKEIDAAYKSYLETFPPKNADGSVPATHTLHLQGGNVLFVRKSGHKIYFSRRQDDRLISGTRVPTVTGRVTGNNTLTRLDENTAQFDGMADIYEELFIEKKEHCNLEILVIEKLEPPKNVFKAKLDLAILQKRKPSFQDAYALLRVATAKQNRANVFSNIMLGDQPGVGVVGHHFSESNRIFRNYYKYGSAMNIYGSSAVPALSQFVSANPIYESMRKFISSFMRFVDRKELHDYRVENGRGVLIFKRYINGPSKRFKMTVLRNMEPSIDPVGWFHENTADPKNPGHSKFVPIQKGKKYKVVATEGTGVYYEGRPYGINSPYGSIFTGNEKDHLDSNTVARPWCEGAFELDGITLAEGKTGDDLKRVTNDWVMFMTSSHYHTSESHIYKPSIYNDIMGFLNNRCHHRSKEYENSQGDKYDMIRSELMRTPIKPWNVPGQMQIFLSKSSPNFNYIFNTNDPEQGNVNLYSETGDGRADYLSSCPAVTPRPYRVIKTEIVNVMGRPRVGARDFNPSSRDINNNTPYGFVKVTLNKPLRGTGRLSVGSRGWRGVSRSLLLKEPYRTDENAILEYLNATQGVHVCKRNMIGDYGSNSEVIEGDGYRPFGACYPRFYFLKLIPRVPNGALLDSEPYAQMDFYFRAMGSAFINPYSLKLDLYNQTRSLNWKFSEIASRSSEEDPTIFDYVDPREITS